MAESSLERNSLIAEIVREFGLASDQEITIGSSQIDQDSNQLTNRFLEDTLCRDGIISPNQKHLLSRIADALDNELLVVDDSALPDLSAGDLPTRNVASETPGDRHSQSFVWKPGEFRGRFRVLRQHARGGLGSVYVAQDPEFSREVALKEIQSQFSQSAECRTRFLFEGRITGQLEHPGIVPVYSLGVDENGNPFYAMRLIHGLSMRSEIAEFYRNDSNRSRVRLEPWLRRMAVRLKDVCYAIEYAHSRAIIHRDIKPSNIMLGNFGETLVVDWGLAKSLKSKSAPQTPTTASQPSAHVIKTAAMPSDLDSDIATRAGAIVGTVSYMSPEQAHGRTQSVDEQTDIFCLGATLYTILTGRAPYDDGNLEDVRAVRFDAPRSINPVIPRSLEAICLKAMARDPQERYPSARALADDLDYWTADQPVSARPEPWLDKCGRWLRKYRSASLASLLVLTTAVAGLMYFNGVVHEKNLLVEKSNQDLRQSLSVARSSSMELLDQAESRANMKSRMRSDVLENVFRMYQQIYQIDPQDSDVAREFARVARTSSNAQRFLGEREEPSRRYQMARKIMSELTHNRALVDAPGDYMQLVEIMMDEAANSKATGDFSQAETLLKSSLDYIDQYRSTDPENNAWLRAEAISTNEMIGVCRSLLQSEKRLNYARRAEQAFTELNNGPDRSPTDPIFLILAYASYGNAVADVENKDEAISFYQRALPDCEKWLARQPDRNIRYATTVFYRNYADFIVKHLDAKQLPLAKSIINKAIVVANQNLKNHPGMGIYRFAKADCWRVQAEILAQQGDLPAAQSKLRLAIELGKPLIIDYAFASIPLGVSKMYRRLAELQTDDARQTKRRLLNQAIECCDLVVTKSSQNKLAIQQRDETAKELAALLDSRN